MQFGSVSVFAYGLSSLQSPPRAPPELYYLREKLQITLYAPWFLFLLLLFLYLLRMDMDCSHVEESDEDDYSLPRGLFALWLGGLGGLQQMPSLQLPRRWRGVGWWCGRKNWFLPCVRLCSSDDGMEDDVFIVVGWQKRINFNRG